MGFLGLRLVPRAKALLRRVAFQVRCRHDYWRVAEFEIVRASGEKVVLWACHRCGKVASTHNVRPTPGRRIKPGEWT